MSEKHELGKKGEQLAANYLIDNGFQILSRNFRHLKAEIDIVARKEGILAIVEVKSRSYDFYEDMSDAVSRKKRGRIVMAADYYVQKHELDLEVRFDIITVIRGTHGFTLEHMPDAFYHF